MKSSAPYGSWESPITSDLIVAGAVRLMEIALDGEDQYWLESRPMEGGRYVIVRRSADGRIADVTPAPFNARTRVHEYGGAPFAVSHGTVYFVNFADQRLYREDIGGEAQPITPEKDLRYADLVLDHRRNHMICVREDHTVVGHEAVNALVALELPKGGEGQVLVSGNDFYSSPRLDPEEARLAWLTWNHPNMPWDGTELMVAEVKADGSLGEIQRVAGGVDESIFQPQWSPDGVLHFVSDRTGWWNLYRWRDGRIEPLCEMEAEFGKPQWVFGMSTYAFESAERIICAYTSRGTWQLGRLDTRTHKLGPIDTPYTETTGVRARPGQAVFLAGSPSEAVSVISLDLGTGNRDVLRSSSELQIDSGFISQPDAIEFPTEGGLTAHALFYAPKNRDYAAPAGERPPLLVISHGGPTGAASSTLSWEIQYWTSRGFAVVDVNYGGSSGYGRAYRQRLDGEWGGVDVDDCANAALYLVEQGKVDGNRLAIRGGSAGGYTTLSALAFRDVFKVGASYYGVSDLEALTRETHKFESRYLDRLVGPYPERKDLYLERSPIHHTERLSCPMILFQGLEDKVVPPNQAQRMVEALRKKGLPVAYLPFEGEQHGFRRAENIKRALDAELYFYSRIFGFELAEPVEPVPIDNLDSETSMTFRSYDPERDTEAIHRLWKGIGWMEKGEEEAMDLFLECGRALVAEVEGEAECLVASVPGTIWYLGEELPLSAMTAVTTSRKVRKRGLAKRVAALTLAGDVADGALVSGLGMFEQGFYNQLGFGTGSYEHWVAFDPAHLKVGHPARLPRRITKDDWAMVHAARLKRMRVHGSCNLLPPEVTRGHMMVSKNGFGFGYLDDSGEGLTHHFWCSTREPDSGPYQVRWMSYQNWGQFLELMGLLGSLGDQVRLIWMREPPAIQLQDLFEQPFKRRQVSEKSKFETVIHASAYWQMRVCDLPACLARTSLKAGELRFNLRLSDPIERHFDDDAAWRGISGEYVVTLGPTSGAEAGADETLPTLEASAGALTRLWLGVRSASSLSITDDLSGPPELLQSLDEALSCLPTPKSDWDF